MLFENMLYCSAWISSNALLLLLTLGPIQFALLKTHEQFQEAVRKHSSSALKVILYRVIERWLYEKKDSSRIRIRSSLWCGVFNTSEARHPQVAISKHDQSWEMIRFADKFASLVVGVSLTTAVPIIAIVGTSLLLPKEVRNYCHSFFKKVRIITGNVYPPGILGRLPRHERMFNRSFRMCGNGRNCCG